jgi:hypothetical protein
MGFEWLERTDVGYRTDKEIIFATDKHRLTQMNTNTCFYVHLYLSVALSKQTETLPIGMTFSFVTPQQS